MAATPRRCKGSEGRICHKILSAKETDSYDLGITCRGQQCNIEVRCDHCKSWTVED